KDSQLLAMTPNYFSRDHSSPTLLGANIYKTNKGRVFRLDIQADRNRFDEDLIFSFSALSNMGQYAKRPFKKYIVVIHSTQKKQPPKIAVGKVRCSFDCFIRQHTTYQEWKSNCLYFKET
nr:hypothetical protein [Candidatus Neomarinimicrobiota bacterium]